MQKRAKLSRSQRPVEVTKRYSFSDANVDVKLCEQLGEKRQLKLQLAFFSSELSENSSFGNGHEL
jgi:G protein-coupled receptor 103